MRHSDVTRRFILEIVLSVFFSLTAISNAFAAEVTLSGAKIYPSPNSEPIESGFVHIVDGTISALGAGSYESLSDDEALIDVSGKIITAGFWNTHVHFSLPPPVTLEQAETYTRDMLLQYGFVHVLDTGSIIDITTGIRDAIESRQMLGPDIILASGSLVPKGSSPFYVRPAVLPDAPVPDQAQVQVDLILGSGADGIKIFTGSIVSLGSVVPMDVAIVRGIADAAHVRGAFVVAHPSNNDGAWAAINGGVDIFAHTFPQDGWDRTIPPTMVKRGIALIPTLKL